LITQRVGPLVELPGLLRDLDVDVDAVFEGSGVSPGSLSPDLRLPFPDLLDLLDLLERAARISGFPHIGLLLGLRFDVTSHHGLIGALMQTAPTLKQALVDFATWQPGYSSGAIVYLNRLGDEYELGYGTYAVSSPGTRVLYDLVAGVGRCMVRQLTGGSVGPIEAHFTHGAEEDGAIYGRLLRMPARFNQPRTGVILKAADMGTAPSSKPDPAPVIDMHTSRIALDWAGTYEGLLACADCAGIHTQLTLEPDGGFEIVTRRLVRDADPASARGQFDWEPAGNAIVLDAEGGGQRFAVGEGRLLLLETGQTQPAWDRASATLPQSSPAWRSSRQDLGDMLEDHRWMLIDGTDATNRRIDALFPDADRSFALNFAGSRLHAQGGCNGFRGAFAIDADDRLGVTGTISTLMACPAPLMEADAALSALLAEPLETVLIRGVQPTLVLLTNAGDALVLTGELTPEARFGAPTTVFLEVAAETAECEESVRGDGLCLQVREISFDEQGLRVGTPSGWQSFTADIVGYQHQPGIRNVLRVKRFEPAAGPDMPQGPIYVLDLVVESEVVTN
jgi:heat shock protein HslJ